MKLKEERARGELSLEVGRLQLETRFLADEMADAAGRTVVNPTNTVHHFAHPGPSRPATARPDTRGRVFPSGAADSFDRKKILETMRSRRLQQQLAPPSPVCKPAGTVTKRDPLGVDKLFVADELEMARPPTAGINAAKEAEMKREWRARLRGTPFEAAASPTPPRQPLVEADPNGLTEEDAATYNLQMKIAHGAYRPKPNVVTPVPPPWLGRSEVAPTGTPTGDAAFAAQVKAQSRHEWRLQREMQPVDWS